VVLERTVVANQKLRVLKRQHYLLVVLWNKKDAIKKLVKESGLSQSEWILTKLL
jgi:hypothetical protein